MLEKRSDITAWVYINDDVATAALHFFRIRGVKQKVAIVGFDNAPHSRTMDLTTYDVDPFRNVTTPGKLIIRGTSLVKV